MFRFYTHKNIGCHVVLRGSSVRYRSSHSLHWQIYAKQVATDESPQILSLFLSRFAGIHQPYAFFDTKPSGVFCSLSSSYQLVEYQPPGPRDRLIFNMGIPRLVRKHFHIEMSPCMFFFYAGKICIAILSSEQHEIRDTMSTDIWYTWNYLNYLFTEHVAV